MREGEMLEDLMLLFAKRKRLYGMRHTIDGTKSAIEKVEDRIVMRHAFPWYDGEVADDSKRWQIFRRQVKRLIAGCARHADNPSKLSDMWIDGVLAIEECHVEEAPLMDRLDGEDLMRHIFNGGTQFGLAKNIKKQMDELIRQDQAEMLKIAKNRHESE